MNILQKERVAIVWQPLDNILLDNLTRKHIQV